MHGDVIARLFTKIDKDGPIPEPCPHKGPCWLWVGMKNKLGYGLHRLPGRRVRVHRTLYEHFVGPIPVGLEIDHLCRTPNCVNPAHLEAVTHAENVRRGLSLAGINSRKTHCKHGHKFTEENTYRGKQGRGCRTCARIAQQRRRDARRLAA